jgi:hypothetical protein
MKRLDGLEKELAKILDPRPPAPRRKPLSEEAIRSIAVQGCLEYLVDLTGSREGAQAQKLLAELEEIPVNRLGESILTSMENLLIEKHRRGGLIFHTLRSRAPERLGRGYAMYRMFQDPAMVVEELFDDYLDYQS